MFNVKCKKCGSEWYVKEEYSTSIGNCPFCGASLAKDEPITFANVQDCFGALIDKYGKEVLADGKKLYSFLADYIPEKRKELQLLKTVCEANVYALFVSVDQGQYNRERKRAIKILSDDHMIAETWASKAIEWVLQAIGCGADNTQCDEIESFAEDSSLLPNKTDVDYGNDLDEYNFGLDYYYGRFGVKQDYELAVEHFIKAAEQGNKYAQRHLGMCYEKGNGVDQDYAEAVKWYRKAAEQRDTAAQYALQRLLGDEYDQEQGEKCLWDAGDDYVQESGEDYRQELDSNDVFRWNKNVYEKDTFSFSHGFYSVKIENRGALRCRNESTLRIKEAGLVSINSAEIVTSTITPSMIDYYMVEQSGIFKKGWASIKLKGCYVEGSSKYVDEIDVSFNLKKENRYEAEVLAEIMKVNGIEVNYV